MKSKTKEPKHNFRISATLNGFEGGNELRVLTTYCVSRDLVITCNEHSLSYYLKNLWYPKEKMKN